MGSSSAGGTGGGPSIMVSVRYRLLCCSLPRAEPNGLARHLCERRCAQAHVAASGTTRYSISKASSRPPPPAFELAPGSVRAFPFVVECSIGVAQPSSLNTRCTFHVRLAKRSGLSTRKKTLFDNGVNAPISIHHLGHPEINGYRDQRDCLVLRSPFVVIKNARIFRNASFSARSTEDFS